MGHYHQLLPDTIRQVLVSGYAIKGQSTLEFSNRFLMMAPAAHELPEFLPLIRQIRGHGGVLIITVIGIEQIQLIILRCLMLDVLTVEDHPQGHVPRFKTQLFFEELDFWSNGVPSFAFLDMGAQADPTPEGHLDSKSRFVLLKELNYRFEEECGVHSEIQSIGLSQRLTNLRKDLAQESKAGLAVMNVTGAVSYPKDMARLSEVGHDRIVAGNPAIMRIISSQGSGNVFPGREHGTIDIQCQSAKRQFTDHSGYDFRIQILKPQVGFPGKTLQPSTQCPRTRKTNQSTESFENRIPIQIQNMAKPLGPYDEEAQEDSDHTGYSEIADQAGTVHIGSYQPIELDDSKIPDQQLQSSVGCEVSFGEFDPEISVDSLVNICFPSSHSLWPFVLVMVFVVNSIKPQRKAFF